MLSLCLVPLASLANSVMDTLSFRWFSSIFNRPGFWQKFAGPDSWQNKYRISQNLIIQYLLKTVLVGFTDLWHFAQMICFTAYQIPIVWDMPIILEGYPIWNFIISLTAVKLIHWAVFETFFEKILKKKIKS